MTHLPDWLQQQAAAAPDRPALIAADTIWSFGALAGAADRLARTLREAGAQAGAPVALLAANRPVFAAAVHAVARCGVTLAPLNTRLNPHELRWQLEDLGAQVLLHDAAYHDLAAASTPAGVRLLALDESPPPPPSSPPLLLNLAAIHTLIYTSGTTGTPKAAQLSYGNHWWSAVGSALNLGVHADDRWLAVLPLFHVGGLAILMRSVIYGMPVVLHERFDPAAINRAIDEQGVTIISVVATMLQRMLAERGDRPYPAQLRCVLLGGGPAPRHLLEACAARNIPVVQTYGMTETASQAVTLAPADALRKLGSAGRPLLPLQVRIDAGHTAPEQVGEIYVRGPLVTAGYRNRPVPLHDGWLATGDLGYLDSEGYLYVVDRRDDLIISGGENVYPAEVEAVLQSHPAVQEAGVVGLADAAWGMVPVAFVAAEPDHALDQQELIAFARNRLAGYKVPRQIVVLAEALPRTAAGKLRRNLLRRRLTELLPLDNTGEVDK
ncbi:MAG: o-succinylbenzoate--CoA ligase [Oscillochloris sp.]|nr:o-succinylbenzoate--CoA ligase [Oscillochloris sp.]